VGRNKSILSQAAIGDAVSAQFASGNLGSISSTRAIPSPPHEPMPNPMHEPVGQKVIGDTVYAITKSGAYVRLTPKHKDHRSAK